MPVNISLAGSGIAKSRTYSTEAQECNSSLENVGRGFRVVAAYVLMVILIGVVSMVAYFNMHRVTISAQQFTVTTRVSSLSVQEALQYTGVYKSAGESGALVTDNAALLKKEGSYLLVSENLGKVISQDMQIKLTSVRVKNYSSSTRVPCTTIYKKTFDLLPGQKRVVQKGIAGLKKETYRVTYRDGKLSLREKLKTEIVRQPVSRVIEQGAPLVKVSRGKRSYVGRIKPGTFSFVSTAYTHTGFSTATGIKPRRGVVAVDPRVIPLGTKLYVEGYGYAVAADTGGAIKGSKVDVFFDTRMEAIKWGRRTVKVTVLG